MSKREKRRSVKALLAQSFNSCIDTDFPSVDIQHLYP